MYSATRRRPIMKSNAIKMNDADNVAVAARVIQSGDPVVVGGREMVRAAEEIPMGHKVALLALGAGDAVLRYGEPIVETTDSIEAGRWVHVHNTCPIPGS